MRDPDLSIYTQNRYEHDEYGEVLVCEIERRVTGLQVKRNDARTTTAVSDVATFYVHFQHRDLHIDGGATKSQKLENFQHAIHD